MKDAAEIIYKRNIGSVVVMDQDTPIGIVTKTELIVASIIHSKPSDTKVTEVMDKHILWVESDFERDDVASTMSKNKRHHVLVRKNGKFVGLTTTLDVVHEAAMDAKAFPYNRSAFKKSMLA